MQKPSHSVHENEQSLGSPAAGSGPLSNPLLSLSHLHVFFHSSQRPETTHSSAGLAGVLKRFTLLKHKQGGVQMLNTT